MVQLLLIGIGIGAAAALLFASAISGSLLSIFLFYLSPLPILIAAIGWSHWAALVAAFFGAVGLALVLGMFFFLAFLIGVGLPAWWLGYLALLARPNEAGDRLDWYPPGNLVVWAALLGALVVVAALPSFGTDEASLRATLKSGVERMLRMDMRTPSNAPLDLPGRPDLNRVIEILILVIPPAAAVFATLTNTLNLWLAGRIIRVSNRLKRPWPDLSAMTFPPYAPLLIAVAAIGSFFSGPVGIVSGVFAASLLMAYALLGLAVLHSITRGMDSRGFVLAGVYAAVAMFYWPILVMSLLGLADTALNIRGRVGRRHPPAPPPPPPT
jgi:hypothetical protein